jgi:alkanesulfonate monooxygenase SsuD/methylene tetrahydromethanopterin reductase-like flavin-dependent oxidoreductase (luciferase family)
MKFSIWPNPARPVQEVLDLARMGDTDGWYCFWYADHYMENTGDESLKPGPVHECWTILPAIAAVTERIRLGPLVSPTSVHHPALLANRAATLDQLSNGRFVLGLGAGWQINEHQAYGIELEAPGKRVSRFEESIQIVESLLANDRTDFHGEFYDFTDAPCDPKPVQSPLPIAVGTGSPRMLKITARHATDWNTWGAPTRAADRHAAFATACESVDVNVASKHTSPRLTDRSLVPTSKSSTRSGSTPQPASTKSSSPTSRSGPQPKLAWTLTPASATTSSRTSPETKFQLGSDPT